jgi:hypothetical protein
MPPSFTNTGQIEIPLEAIWALMGNPDPRVAWSATRQMALTRQSPGFLAERARRLVNDPARWEEWIRKLGDEEAPNREAAFSALSGANCRELLLRSKDLETDPEIHSRVVRLLAMLSDPRVRDPEGLRWMRAVWVLGMCSEGSAAEALKLIEERAPWWHVANAARITLANRMHR